MRLHFVHLFLFTSSVKSSANSATRRNRHPPSMCTIRRSRIPSSLLSKTKFAQIRFCCVKCEKRCASMTNQTASSARARRSSRPRTNPSFRHVARQNRLSTNSIFTRPTISASVSPNFARGKCVSSRKCSTSCTVQQ